MSWAKLDTRLWLDIAYWVDGIDIKNLRLVCRQLGSIGALVQCRQLVVDGRSDSFPPLQTSDGFEQFTKAKFSSAVVVTQNNASEFLAAEWMDTRLQAVENLTLFVDNGEVSWWDSFCQFTPAKSSRRLLIKVLERICEDSLLLDRVRLLATRTDKRNDTLSIPEEVLAVLMRRTKTYAHLDTSMMHLLTKHCTQVNLIGVVSGYDLRDVPKQWTATLQFYENNSRRLLRPRWMRTIPLKTLQCSMLAKDLRYLPQSLETLQVSVRSPGLETPVVLPNLVSLAIHYEEDCRVLESIHAANVAELALYGVGGEPQSAIGWDQLCILKTSIAISIGTELFQNPSIKQIVLVGSTQDDYQQAVEFVTGHAPNASITIGFKQPMVTPPPWLALITNADYFYYRVDSSRLALTQNR